MSLQSTLITKLKHIEPIIILQKMGYRKITDKIITRFLETLSDNLLGLENRQFDFKFSNIDFIKALCRACDTDFDNYSDALFESQVKYRQLHYGFRPYIFADTGFKRASQSILMLAFLEGRRNITLPIENKLKSIDDQVDYVKHLIVEHYKQTEGHIEFWGNIKQYLFIFSDSERFIFNSDGSFSDSKNLPENRATVKLRKKDILTILKNKEPICLNQKD